MVKVRPIGDDISIVSFTYDEEKIAMESEGKSQKKVLGEKGEKEEDEKKNKKTKPRPKKRSRLSRFFTAWTSTVPEAVGVTGLGYIVSSQDSILRR